MGDFNAHSPVWNPRCTTRRDARFLEDLIDTFDLTVLNDDSPTRLGGENHSIIDLTLANGEALAGCRDWKVLSDASTGSDHLPTTWKWDDPRLEGPNNWRFQGWALREQLEKEKEEIGRAHV